MVEKKEAQSLTGVISHDLEAAKLGAPDKPEEDKWRSLPEDVTRISLRELGRYYQGYVAYAEYAEYELAKAESRSMELEESLSRMVSKVTAENSELPKWRRDTVLDQNNTYRVLSHGLMKSTIRCVLLKAVVGRYNRRVSLISREITRREAELNPQRRRPV